MYVQRTATFRTLSQETQGAPKLSLRKHGATAPPCVQGGGCHQQLAEEACLLALRGPAGQLHTDCCT